MIAAAGETLETGWLRVRLLSFIPNLITVRQCVAERGDASRSKQISRVGKRDDMHLIDTRIEPEPSGWRIDFIEDAGNGSCSSTLPTC